MLNKVEILRQTEMFRDLDQNVLLAVAGKAVEKTLAKDEILFIAGEEARGLFVIIKGSARAFRSAPDGREQVIHVERAVTTIAEVPVFDGGPYPSTVAADEPSKVLFVDKSTIRSLCMEHPELALAVAALLGRRLRQCAELVETLSLREVGQRLAKFLLDQGVTGTRSSAGITFKQTLTHNQLAARIGSVREVVTRAMYRLQNQGFITVTGKTIVVRDPEALKQYAGVD